MTPRARRLWAGFLGLYLAEQALLWALYWWPAPKVFVGDEGQYLARALGVAGLGPLPPKEWLWPPLQHWFLGGLLRLSGQSLVAVQLVQNLLLLLAAGCLRGIWLALDGRRRAANLAAALFLLNPSVLAFAWWLWPEPLHLVLMLGAILLALRGRSAVAGVLAGLAILAKSLLMPFWPAFALLWWRDGWRAVLARGLVFAAALGLTLAPMLWYGWRQTGAPMIADSSGFNLAGGLADRWRSDYIDDAVAPLYLDYRALPGPPQARNAVMLQAARDLVREQGLAATLQRQLGKQYFRLFSAKTALASQLPGPHCAGYLGAYRLGAGAVRDTVLAYIEAWHLAVLALAAFGLALWPQWRRPLVAFVGLFLAYQLALFLPLHVKARFLLPMLPFLSGFAAQAVLARGEWRQTGRVAIGAALALLLLFLAVGGPWLDRSCA